MSVAQRYTDATQSFAGNTNQANEFQARYNQQFYNDFLSENNAYKSAVETRKAFKKAAEEKSKDLLAAAIAKDKETGSRYVDAGMGAVGAVEALKAIKSRVKKAMSKKADSKTDNDPDGSGGDAEQGDATETTTGSGVEQENDVSNVADRSAESVPDSASEVQAAVPESQEASSAVGVGEETGETGNFFGRGLGEFSVDQGKSFAGIVDPASKTVPDRMGIDMSSYSGLEGRDVASTSEVNAERTAQYTEALGEDTAEFGTEAAGAILGGTESGLVAAGATEEAAAAAGATMGEVAGTLLAAAPEVAGIAAAGYGLYELFAHHHHKAPPPDMTAAPPVPQKPALLTATQGATSDLRNSRAEFTTPSFDSVTDFSGSVSAF